MGGTMKRMSFAVLSMFCLTANLLWPGCEADKRQKVVEKVRECHSIAGKGNKRDRWTRSAAS
jgi:hypothetical protein